MEAMKKPVVEISIAGKNVTTDVSPYLSKISSDDRLEAESDSIDLTFEDTGKLWQTSWFPQKGDTLAVKLGYSGNLLDCGAFEIDEISFDTPPDTLTVRALAASITKSLRTRNSKAFESQSLAKIAQYFADKHGLKVVGSSSELQNIEIDRKTQEDQTDLSFLAGIAKEYGFIFSVRGKQLVFMDVEDLESTPATMVVNPEMLNKCSLKDKTSQTFGAVVISKRNARTGSVTKCSIDDDDDEGADTLVIDENVDNDAQAQARARGALKEKNKDKTTGSVGFDGDTRIVAGMNIDLTGYGQFSGKWHVFEARHSVDSQGGYTTEASIRKIVPKKK